MTRVLFHDLIGLDPTIVVKERIEVVVEYIYIYFGVNIQKMNWI